MDLLKLMFRPYKFAFFEDNPDLGGGGGGNEPPAEDFKAKYEELSAQHEKVKDVDPEKWAALKEVDAEKWEQVKDIDLEEYKSAKDLYQNLAKNEALRKQVEDLIQKGSANIPAGGKLPPEIEQLKGELNSIKQVIQSERQERWMEEYGKKVSSGLEGALKTEAFKEVGELLDFEREAVQSYIDLKFEQDAQLKTPKLSLKDVERFVPEAIKRVMSQRAATLEKFANRQHDFSPAPIGDKAPAGKGKGPISDNDRVKVMVDTFRKSQTLTV